jgi:AcrR family transcriptional regulator
MTRTYRKAKRADAQEETREKIVRATMALHLGNGVATTSYADVAKRAGVGAATVYRHFPTMGALVEACGAHVWRAIRPPRSEDAATLFAGLRSRTARIERLVGELDDFYDRAAAPLWSAVRDHDRVPELALFLKEVLAGVTALLAQALDDDPRARAVEIAAAVADFTVWRALARTGADRKERSRMLVAMIDGALAARGHGSATSSRTARRRRGGGPATSRMV